MQRAVGQLVISMNALQGQNQLALQNKHLQYFLNLILQVFHIILNILHEHIHYLWTDLLVIISSVADSCLELQC